MDQALEQILPLTVDSVDSAPYWTSSIKTTPEFNTAVLQLVLGSALFFFLEPRYTVDYSCICPKRQAKYPCWYVYQQSNQNSPPGRTQPVKHKNRNQDPCEPCKANVFNGSIKGSFSMSKSIFNSFTREPYVLCHKKRNVKQLGDSREVI